MRPILVRTADSLNPPWDPSGGRSVLGTGIKEERRTREAQQPHGIRKPPWGLNGPSGAGQPCDLRPRRANNAL